MPATFQHKRAASCDVHLWLSQNSHSARARDNFSSCTSLSYFYFPSCSTSSLSFLYHLLVPLLKMKFWLCETRTQFACQLQMLRRRVAETASKYVLISSLWPHVMGHLLSPAHFTPPHPEPGHKKLINYIGLPRSYSSTWATLNVLSCLRDRSKNRTESFLL